MNESQDQRLLRELKPYLRSGTLLSRTPSTVEETRQLYAGAGGTYLDGLPYLELDLPWPACTHKLPMKFQLQVDARDALHQPVIPGLYVVFECNAPMVARLTSANEGLECPPVVLHYLTPLRVRRQGMSVDVAKPTRFVATRTSEFLPEPDLLDKVAPELVARLETPPLDEPWGRAYWRMWSRSESHADRYEDHLGGWHVTNPDRLYLPPPCIECGELPLLVLQIEWGDGNKSLWACPQHPARTHFRFHK